MFDTSNLSSKNNTASFVDNVLTSKFYLEYLSRTKGPTDVGGGTNNVSGLGLKTLGRAVSTMGILCAAPAGVVWNGVCTVVSSLYWGSCVVTRVTQDKLDVAARNTASYARATFDDMTFSAIPFMYIAGRVISLQMSKLSHYLPAQMFNPSNLPKIVLFSRVGFIAIGAIALFKTARAIDNRIQTLMLKKFTPRAPKEKNNKQLKPLSQEKNNKQLKPLSQNPPSRQDVVPLSNSGPSTSATSNSKVEETDFAKLLEDSGATVSAVKDALVRMYAGGTLHDLSDAMKEMPPIKDVWDINVLVKYFDAIRGKSTEQNVNNAIEKIVSDLSSTRDGLVAYQNEETKVPFLSDAIAVGEETKADYFRRVRYHLCQTEQTLMQEVFMKAYFLMFNLGISPHYCYPFNGNAMAQPLENLQFQDEHLQGVVASQIQNLKSLQRKIDFYKTANGDPETFSTFEEFPILDYLRDQYANYLQGAEVELIGHINAINREVAFFANDGMTLNGAPVEPVPFSLPISAHSVVHLLGAILGTYGTQFQEGSRSNMEEKYRKAFELQQNVDVYRLADRFILQLTTNRQKPDDCNQTIWARVQRPSPLSYVDYPRAMADKEYQIVQLVANLNNKEFTHIRERFKIDVDPLPYECPLDVDGAIELITGLTQNIIKIQNYESNEELQNVVRNLNSYVDQLDELQQSLLVFRSIYQALPGNQSMQQPVLHMDPKIYETIFYEGSAESNPAVSNVLDECKLDDQLDLTSLPKEYIEFRSRISAFKEALPKQEQPNLMAYHYFGLKAGFTKEELKAAKQTYVAALHPDKRNGIGEAGSLFSCMNALYKICEQMAEQSATPMKVARKQNEGKKIAPRILALTFDEMNPSNTLFKQADKK